MVNSPVLPQEPQEMIRDLWSRIVALLPGFLFLFLATGHPLHHQQGGTLAASAQAFQQQHLSEGQTWVGSSGNDRQRLKTPFWSDRLLLDQCRGRAAVPIDSFKLHQTVYVL